MEPDSKAPRLAHDKTMGSKYTGMCKSEGLNQERAIPKQKYSQARKRKEQQQRRQHTPTPKQGDQPRPRHAPEKFPRHAIGQKKPEV